MAKYMKLGTGQLYIIYKTDKLLFLQSKKKQMYNILQIMMLISWLIKQSLWKLLVHILALESLIHPLVTATKSNHSKT